MLLALPLLLVASVAAESIIGAIMVAFFALVGVFSDHYYFTHQAKPRPMPALPLIAVWAIVGYVGYLLIF
jgi:presenilin-like A22 family membrane protease